MEAPPSPPLAGLVLPARHALRLGALGVIALMTFAVYGNAAYHQGAGYALGVAMVGTFFALVFGAIVAGLIASGLWQAWHGNWPAAADPAMPPALDNLLIAVAMVVPAGIAALALGSALAGNAHPLAVHLGLLAALATLALVTTFGLHGLVRAAALGFCLWLAVIVADSMRLEGQLLADAARIKPDLPRCMAIGPQGMPLAQVPPLMGLTAPKPILLHIADPTRPRFLRWSFRWHGFVRGGIRAEDLRCTPALL
ncbi:hypothetical protein [Rhodobacter ferrooxidans]|uniref:Uncharacterized protein n=1 Tax=Rhodobacter ferrooxidans TaxID=371731 RepID=C8S1K7_9RHOB|nr:hypothetical protein [Rhodobacter sp. SW2]EEW25180.1 hypothetical protein Rsw2DRAFT_1935 [Rhodobacter sp. SW2]